ncbi:MAG: hypothetical protein GXP62_11415 [Oligoflexia bacterium]|nr:hypothetical protein [Oligoflexia bacterium]
MTRQLALACLTALLSSGCYKIDYVAGPSNPMPQSTQWHHIGIFGLIEFSAPVRLDQICPNGFARVHNEISVVNGLAMLAVNAVTVGTLGWAYQPHTVQVYCSSGQAYNVQLNGDGLAMSAQRVDPVEAAAPAE